MSLNSYLPTKKKIGRGIYAFHFKPQIEGISNKVITNKQTQKPKHKHIKLLHTHYSPVYHAQIIFTPFNIAIIKSTTIISSVCVGNSFMFNA